MKTDSTAKKDQRSIISYEQHSCCPVCGSQHFTVGTERSELLQPSAIPVEKLHLQANVRFTSALCEHCGIAFNVSGLSDKSRVTIYNNDYSFIKPSTGIGSSNYLTFISEVHKHLKSKDDAVLEIGGYDGYLLRELSKEGFTDLTLVDPSAQTNDNDDSLSSVTTISGFFPADDPVYISRTSCRAYTVSGAEPSAAVATASADTTTAHAAAVATAGTAADSKAPKRLYKVAAAKDVLQMIPDPMGFVRGINAVLEVGGIAVITSVPLQTMHSLQCVHLGINAYTYLAQHNGFTLIDTYKRPENGYVVYVLRKDVDVLSEPERAAAFAATAQRTKEEFAAEQDKQRKLIMNTSLFGPEAAVYLNERVAHHAALGHEIVLYGTGFYSFDILGALKTELSSLNLTLVNSSEEQDCYRFMLPDGSTLPVEYSKRALYSRTIPLLILGIKSPLFKAEIMSLLASINCRCEEILYLPDYDK